MKGGRIASTKGAAIDIKVFHARHGASQVTIQDATIEAAQPDKVGKGNKVTVNGRTNPGAAQP